jgi:hypothetical protein
MIVTGGDAVDTNTAFGRPTRTSSQQWRPSESASFDDYGGFRDSAPRRRDDPYLDPATL